MIYGYIYKLFCLDTREMYIGSTTNLKKRKNTHEAIKNSSVSKQIINRKNYIFLLLQEGLYINKEHLRAIEDNYIGKLPCINNNRSFSNRYEYYKNYIIYKKETLAISKKKYRQNNKQKIKEKEKDRIPCEFCSKLGNRDHKRRHLKTCKKNPNNFS